MNNNQMLNFLLDEINKGNGDRECTVRFPMYVGAFARKLADAVEFDARQRGLRVERVVGFGWLSRTEHFTIVGPVLSQFDALRYRMSLA